MAEGRPPVSIRDVGAADVEVFFEHQQDPRAIEMAAFPARDHTEHADHWHKILLDPHVVARTILSGDEVAGSIVSWSVDGKHLVGYWIGSRFWGRGIATNALRLFLDSLAVRPLYAYVSTTNRGSIRVLEKCGFRPVGSRSEDGDVEELLFELVS